MPIRYSKASGSVTFAHNLATTNDYTSMIEQTRTLVDDDGELHAWMAGVPFSFWEQYLTIVDIMVLIGGLSIAAGCVISFAFLLVELNTNGHGTCLQRICASFMASLLIGLGSAATLVTVVDLCSLLEVKLSGFTAMSCVMSIALYVEYSVHIVHRFLEAPPGSGGERVAHAMEWLFAPSAMAFLTSAISVVMMAFSEFRFVRLYFFVPLALAVLTSYFYGCIVLPCVLGFVNFAPAFAEERAEVEKSRDKESLAVDEGADGGTAAQEASGTQKVATSDEI
jgi:hypothetical protein